MNWALGTGWFFLLKWTLFKAFSGVIQKLLAIITKLVFIAMQVVTVHRYHGLDGLDLPINARLLTKHVEHLSVL